MGDELLRTALQILTAYLDRTEPNSADVNLLRQAVPAPQSSWDADELACFVVRRELAARRQDSSDVETARAEWVAAMTELNEIIADIPSGLPRPDGQFRVEKAGAKRAAAYNKYFGRLKASGPSKQPDNR